MNNNSMTVVYNTSNLSQKQIKDITNTNEVIYMEWGHIPYKMDIKNKEAISIINELLHELWNERHAYMSDNEFKEEYEHVYNFLAIA